MSVLFVQFYFHLFGCFSVTLTCERQPLLEGFAPGSNILGSRWMEDS